MIDRSRAPVRKIADSHHVVKVGLVVVAALLGCAGLAAWYIHSASIDVVYSDTWGYIGMIGDYLSGRLNLAEIYAPHWQNRPVLLNLVLLLSAGFDALNVKHIEYLGVLFSTLTTASLIIASSRLFEGRMWTALSAFLVVTALVLSLAQWENYLLAINFVFFSTVTFSVLGILLVNRHLVESQADRLSWPWAGAIACGELALLSSGGGIVQWAVNVLQMLWFSARFRRRIGIDLVGYLLIAAMSITAYVRGLDPHPPGWLQPPALAAAMEFLLIGTGNSLVGYYQNQPLVQLDMMAGAILWLTYVFAMVSHFRLPTLEQKRTTGLLCLILLGIGEQFLIALGRISYGVTYSAASRYASLTLISVAGALLLLAYCASRSALAAATGILFGLTVATCVAVSDYQELCMASARRAYGHNLKNVLLNGRIGDAELRLLQWEDIRAIKNGNEILRRYHLSFYHHLP